MASSSFLKRDSFCTVTDFGITNAGGCMDHVHQQRGKLQAMDIKRSRGEEDTPTPGGRVDPPTTAMTTAVHNTA